jgi:hypothetical protein
VNDCTSTSNHSFLERSYALLQYLFTYSHIPDLTANDLRIQSSYIEGPKYGV